jgi:DNA-binding NarL/FixJ family response regulator
MRVLIIDDHPIVFEGCRHLLTDAGADSLLHTQSLADGLRACRDKRPDMILVDLAMRAGALAGLSFIRRLRLYNRQVPILVFSMHDDPLIASEALKIGANGYVVKDAPPEEIAKAFETVRGGSSYLSHALASEIAFLEARRRTSNPIQSMSPRELLVLSQLAEGRSYRQIAANLVLSYKTVANICGRLKLKLGARSLPELMQIAIQHLPTAPRPEHRGAKRQLRDMGE